MTPITDHDQPTRHFRDAVGRCHEPAHGECPASESFDDREELDLAMRDRLT